MNVPVLTFFLGKGQQKKGKKGGKGKDIEEDEEPEEDEKSKGKKGGKQAAKKGKGQEEDEPKVIVGIYWEHFWNNINL